MQGHYVIAMGVAILAFQSSAHAKLIGWQEMRVIHQEGRPQTLCVGDVNGDGRDELIAVNSQHSRLDIYHWLAPDQRSERPWAHADRPNDLPMPADFRREELPMEHLPWGVALRDLDGDEQLELIALVSPPNKILVHERDTQGKWNLRETFDLLTGDLAPRRKPLLIRDSANGPTEIYVGCTNGIQRLALSPGSRPDWITPREQRGRTDWWLADIDGDDDLDLVEHLRETHQTVRWFERARSGHLLPAQAIFDRAIHGAAVMRSKEEAAQVLLLDGATRGLLRRYQLSRGKSGPLGQRHPLALRGGQKAIWCGLQIDDSPALVVADRGRPQLLVYRWGEDGWGSQQTYPVINDVRAIAAPQAQPGTLLLWTQDAKELYISTWEHGRMSYPTPWPQSQDGEARQIVALDSVGSTTWWLQQVGNDYDLYVWPTGQAEPTHTRFTGVNIKKGAHAQWLGDQRLLVRQQYRAEPVLFERVGEKTNKTTLSHLQKVPLDELRLVAVEDEIRLARRSNGVLQWLGKDLHPVDQIMLPQERKLAGYAALDRRRGWALEDGGRFIHLLEVDSTGIARVKEIVRINGGLDLANDPVLGLVLVNHDYVVRLSEGRPDELKLVESIDGRRNRRSGVKEANIHRVRCLDISGDGSQEVLLFDDQRHQLSVLAQQDGKLKAQMSWPVFEDAKYPYADEQSGPTVTEPRTVVALDADGDGHQDLAMACHDRIVIYLSNEKP